MEEMIEKEGDPVPLEEIENILSPRGADIALSVVAEFEKHPGVSVQVYSLSENPALMYIDALNRLGESVCVDFCTPDGSKMDIFINGVTPSMVVYFGPEEIMEMLRTSEDVLAILDAPGPEED